MFHSNHTVFMQDTSVITQASESQTAKFDLSLQLPFQSKYRGRHLQRALHFTLTLEPNAGTGEFLWENASVSSTVIK